MYIINKHYIVLIFIIYVLYNYLLQGSTTEFLVEVPQKDLPVFHETPVTEVRLFSIPYQLIINKLCTHFYCKHSCIYFSQQCTSNRPHQINLQKRCHVLNVLVLCTNIYVLQILTRAGTWFK
jgi:hypothetical protein